MASARTPWHLIAALYLTGLLAGAQFTKISLTLGQLAEVYPGAPVALAVSGVAVMGVLFGVVAGGLAARFGARRSILWALTISALAGGAGALLPPFPIFMALRVVEGAGHLMLVVAVPTLMAGLAAEKDRPMVMGLWSTFFGVGFAAVALLADHTINSIYSFHTLSIFLMLAVLAWLLPRGAQGAAGRAPRLSDHKVIYTTPRLFAPGLGHGLYAMLFLALVTFLPDGLGAPWLAAVLPIVSIAGSFLAGVLARVIAPGRLVWGGFGLFGALLGVAWVAGPFAPYVLIVAVIASGVIAGAGFAAVPWLNGSQDQRALANGALAQLGNVGTFTGTPVLAALAPPAHLPVAAGVCVVAAVLTGLAYRVATRVD